MDSCKIVGMYVCYYYLLLLLLLLYFFIAGKCEKMFRQVLLRDL